MIKGLAAMLYTRKSNHDGVILATFYSEVKVAVPICETESSTDWPTLDKFMTSFPTFSGITSTSILKITGSTDELIRFQVE